MNGVDCFARPTPRFKVIQAESFSIVVLNSEVLLQEPSGTEWSNDSAAFLISGCWDEHTDSHAAIHLLNVIPNAMG